MIEQSSKTLKVLLGILLVILVATVTYVFYTQKGILSKQAGTNMPIVSPEASTSPTTTPTTSVESAQAKMKAIQDQVNAGTLSREEAKKKLEALSATVAPPTVPADVLKQLEAQKKK